MVRRQLLLISPQTWSFIPMIRQLRNAKVGIYLHIDQAPVLTNHDTLKVQEADTLNSLIPVMDDAMGKIIVKLLTKNSKASIRNTDTANYFIYRPDYDDAGVQLFAISMADVNGNKRNDTLIVLVLEY